VRDLRLSQRCCCSLRYSRTWWRVVWWGDADVSEDRILESLDTDSDRTAIIRISRTKIRRHPLIKTITPVPEHNSSWTRRISVTRPINGSTSNSWPNFTFFEPCIVIYQWNKNQ
jgi:hypothetical protein